LRARRSLGLAGTRASIETRAAGESPPFFSLEEFAYVHDMFY